MDLVGLEDDPDFWNMTLESSSTVGLAPLETTKLEGKILSVALCGANNRLSISFPRRNKTRENYDIATKAQSFSTRSHQETLRRDGIRSKIRMQSQLQRQD